MSDLPAAAIHNVDLDVSDLPRITFRLTHTQHAAFEPLAKDVADAIRARMIPGGGRYKRTPAGRLAWLNAEAPQHVVREYMNLCFTQGTQGGARFLQEQYDDFCPTQRPGRPLGVRSESVILEMARAELLRRLINHVTPEVLGVMAREASTLLGPQKKSAR
jgi:hypothetical protein